MKQKLTSLLREECGSMWKSHGLVLPSSAVLPPISGDSSVVLCRRPPPLMWLRPSNPPMGGGAILLCSVK
eukprot:scaffold11082_cov113-Skeletonema_marinoi.AAC.1